MTSQAERQIDLDGLRTTVVGPDHAALTVVMLHGYAMRPSDLAPFAHSIGVPALFLFPRGPVSLPDGAHAWWSVDAVARAADLSVGPRDMSNQYPEGLGAARQHFGRLLEAAAVELGSPSLVIGGFSQGGMLALDWILRGTRHPDALVLLSSSRLAMNDWLPRRTRLQNLPVYVSHGTADQDLAFSAGEGLRDFVSQGGARLTWVPFAGGHETPLVVWRGLRKFLLGLLE
jgi:phospholipase/carboxylesterase